MTISLWPPRQYDEPPYPPHWTELARCAEVDNALFFPEKGGSVREAKAVCHRCEVRSECLEYALKHEERFGIWGGLSERERRQESRRRQSKTPQSRERAAA